MKPLSLRVYERLCPDDPIFDDDPRRDAIVAEVRYLIDERRWAFDAAEELRRWKHWDIPNFWAAWDMALKALNIASELRGTK